MSAAKVKKVTGYSFNLEVNGTINIPIEELNAIVRTGRNPRTGETILLDGVGHGTYDGCDRCIEVLEMWLESEVEITSVLYEAWATSVDKASEIESY